MSLPNEFIQILQCPKRSCRGDVVLTLTEKQERLVCKICGDSYPVVDGIPVMFPNAAYSPNIHQRHWDQSDNALGYAKKYDSYIKKDGSAWGLYTHISELNAIKKLIRKVDFDASNKVILDCGCGNGRLLSEFDEAKTKIGLDASLILLQATKARRPDYWLVCGQLEDMPFKDCVADLSVSIRVFQHLKAPQHAFGEMTRVTHPASFIVLENYNRYNLKALYKAFRMIPSIQKIWPWGLSYDKYDSYRDINAWCEDHFVKPLDFAGAGWGFHFYLFDFIKFRGIFPQWLQKPILDCCLFAEDIVGLWPIFSKTMEKICFIGSIQSGKKTASLPTKLMNRYKSKRQVKEAAGVQTLLQDRNYCYAGSDLQHLRSTVDWLKKAQDATVDGGVSRGFSMVSNGKNNASGWQPSYPETTGYIIPTFITCSNLLNDPDLLRRARLMADWEIGIQYPDGGVHAGNISTKPNKSIFDAGQVIRGFSAIYKKTGEKKYLDAALRSADWILENEHRSEGRWETNNAACVNPQAITYYSYAIAPIVELGLLMNDTRYTDLGRRTAEFVCHKQNDIGWFAGADFSITDNALLHPIAYTIDGLFDIGISLQEVKFINAAVRSLDGVLAQMDEKGRLPGRLNSEWKGSMEWVCLTGIAQIAVTSMKQYERTKNNCYLDSAQKAKEFLKTCQNNFLPQEGGGLGAMWGSWPISGEYGKYEALNWPAKYFLDLIFHFIELDNKNLQSDFSNPR